MSESSAQTAFKTTGWVNWLGGIVEQHQDLMRRLADVETNLLEQELDAHPVKEPVFISGLARSGTTILLEILSEHPDVGTHQYRDFPLVQMPYWWNWLLKRIETDNVPARERAHGDRIIVTPSSPEAMDEVIWMHWFGKLHDPAESSVLGADTDYPEFEQFFRNHVRKLLLARGATRYVSKGNYSLTRLAYIRKIFPDARILVPVRSPLTQIPSMMRQHERFNEGLADNPKGRAHLRRIGHFEFGPDRQPINAGNHEVTRSIMELWANGEEVRGWARYWASIYDFVSEQLNNDPQLAAACRFVRYEDLCGSPHETLSAVISHSGLGNQRRLLERQADRLQAPRYYDRALSETEKGAVGQECGEVAARFGYEL